MSGEPRKWFVSYWESFHTLGFKSFDIYSTVIDEHPFVWEIRRNREQSWVSIRLISFRELTVFDIHVWEALRSPPKP